MDKSKIDELIMSKNYELQCLIAYRDIVSTGDCNVCYNKDCGYRPKPGQMVRYNCPFYRRATDEDRN